MAKVKSVKLETEIERCRAEHNWDRLRDLLPQLATKGSGLEVLATFLQGEEILESFLDMFGSLPKPDKSFRDHPRLLKARELLTQVKDSSVKQQYKIEARLLLSKLHYITARFKDAVDCVNDSGWEKPGVDFQSLRTLRLVAEAYAIKGLSLETQMAKSANRFQRSEKEEQILVSFEKAAELAVIYLQELDKTTGILGTTIATTTQQTSVSSTSTTGTLSSSTTVAASGVNLVSLGMSGSGRHQDSIGPLMEIAMQRVPIMQIKEDQRDIVKSHSRRHQKRRLSPHLGRAKSVETETPPEQRSQLSEVIEVIRARKKSFVVSSSNISLSPPPNNGVAQIYFAPADGLRRGLEKYRQFLRLVDRKASQHLQEILSRQLAELLIRGIPSASYIPPLFSSNQPPLKTSNLPNPLQSTGAPPGSTTGGVTPSGNANVSLRLMMEKQQQKEMTFVPQNRMEEALLALLVSESIACREAVLSRAPEHAEMRIVSLQLVKAAQNLLTLVLSSLRQYQLLSEVLERALKLASNDQYLWLQFALGLMCNRRFARSSLVLRECLRIGEANSSNLQVPNVGNADINGSRVSLGGHMGVLMNDLADETDGICLSTASPRHSVIGSSSVTSLNTTSPPGITLDPAVIYMIDASLCIEHLGRYQEGIALAEKAIIVCQGGWLTGRAHILLGLGNSLLAQTIRDHGKRKLMEREAVGNFLDAIRCDPKDFLAEFFLALQFAISRNTLEARRHCERSLSMLPDHAASVLLMALLLTSEQANVEALELIEEGLEEHPNHLGLLVLRLKLEMRMGKTEEALCSAKDLLLFWKKGSASVVRQMEVPSQQNGTTMRGPGSTLNPKRGGAVSEHQVTITSSSVKYATLTAGTTVDDLASIRAGRSSEVAESIVPNSGLTPGSEFGAALSSVSDSLGLTVSSHQRALAYTMWRLQADIWLELGELFLEANRLDEVELCVEEALATFPSSHQAIYLKGKLKHLAGRLNEAKTAYLSALSVYPGHIASLRQLALVYQAEGNMAMAEKTLRDLVSIDPLDHLTWFALGRVLADQRDPQSGECFTVALSLEQTTPLLPYAVIPRVIQV